MRLSWKISASLVVNIASPVDPASHSSNQRRDWQTLPPPQRRVPPPGWLDSLSVARNREGSVPIPGKPKISSITDRAAQQEGRWRPNSVHNGYQGVAQRMPIDHVAVREALGPRCTYIVLAQHLQHRRAGQPRHRGTDPEPDRRRRQVHLLNVAHGIIPEVRVSNRRCVMPPHGGEGHQQRPRPKRRGCSATPPRQSAGHSRRNLFCFSAEATPMGTPTRKAKEAPSTAISSVTDIRIWMSCRTSRLLNNDFPRSPVITWPNQETYCVVTGRRGRGRG